jgi:hypothetical protein
MHKHSTATVDSQNIKINTVHIEINNRMKTIDFLHRFVDNAKYIFLFRAQDHKSSFSLFNAIKTNYNFYRPVARIVTDEHQIIVVGMELRHLEQSIINQFPDVKVEDEQGCLIFTFP